MKLHGKEIIQDFFIGWLYPGIRWAARRKVRSPLVVGITIWIIIRKYNLNQSVWREKYTREGLFQVTVNIHRCFFQKRQVYLTGEIVVPQLT